MRVLSSASPMHTICIEVCIVVVVATSGLAQSYYSPLEVPTDPRAVAMGESHVAYRANSAALMFNPAGLAELHGAGISYARRSVNWMKWLDQFVYYGIDAFAETPIGVFGVYYNRFNQGDVIVRTSTSPMGIGEASLYSHAVALGYGREIVNGLEAGIAAKYYDIVMSATGPSLPTLTLQSTTPAWLFDAGLLYTIPIYQDGEGWNHAIAFGASVQNIGTALKSTYLITEIEQTASEKQPQYLRLGFSYSIGGLSCERCALTPFSALLTAEYSNVLNAEGPYVSARDYWGWGMEATIYELVSLRCGWVIMPFTSIYGQKGEPMLRGGAALHLPFRVLGSGLPLVLSGSFSMIPIDRYPNAFMGGDKTSLSSFSIGLRYEYDSAGQSSPE